MAQTLTDSFLFEYELLEGKDSDGKGSLKARGLFAHADIPTANGRVYPGKIWEREIKRIEEKVKNRACFGMLDHPKDGKTTLSEASHLITDINYDGNKVTGTMEVLDTPTGKTLKAILEGGGKVGVSSRGIGTTRKNSEGKDQVQDDYQLFTWDFVADPAVSTALPEFFKEETEDRISEDEIMSITVDQLKEKHPELIKQLSSEIEARVAESLKDDFHKKFLSTVSDQEDEVAERVRSEMLSDPEVGAAKAFVESLKRQFRPFLLDEDTEAVVQAKEQEIEDLKQKISDQQDEISQYKGACEEAVKFAEGLGYRYYMEKTLSMLEDNDVKERAVSLMGDVSRFGSNEEFKGALISCVEHLKEEEENREEEDSRIRELEAKNEALEMKLQKAVQLVEASVARAYAERKIAEHPHRAKLRQIIESVDVRNPETVDAIVEKWNEKNHTSMEYEDISTKLGGGLSHLQEDEEISHGGNGISDRNTILGVSMDELAQLSGIINNDNDGRPY